MYDANRPHKKRCALIEQKMKKRFLKKEGYQNYPPFKSQDWMRTDDPASEIHPPLRYGPQTENEHIIKTIKKVS